MTVSALAPLIAASLIAATGTSLSVSLYVAAMSMLTLVSVILVTQTDLIEGSKDLNEETASSAP